MNRISIQDLKGQLSAAVAEAERGSTIVITRHNRPVAKLTPAGVAHVHIGKRYGRAKLKPALRGNTKGRYLEALWFHVERPIDRFLTLDQTQAAAARELGLPA